MAQYKISGLIAYPNSTFGVNDKFEVSYLSSGVHYSRYLTGTQIINTVVAQTITDGVTTSAPSQNAVFDALALKSDLNPRVQSVTSSATVTATSTNDLVKVTAQAAALLIGNPTGTFSEGQSLMYRIKDDGTARAITYDTKIRAIGVTLPTTTVISKTTYLGVIYNSTDDKYDVIGVTTQA